MYHEQHITVRIKTKYLKLISQLVKKKPEHYESQSQFIRSAVIRLLREEESIAKIETVKSYEVNGKVKKKFER